MFSSATVLRQLVCGQICCISATSESLNYAFSVLLVAAAVMVVGSDTLRIDGERIWLAGIDAPEI